MKKCKGQLFKADISSYVTKRGYVYTYKLNKLKKLSCEGCPKCNWINEALLEYKIINLHEIENGKIYTVDTTNEIFDSNKIILTYDLKLIERANYENKC